MGIFLFYFMGKKVFQRDSFYFYIYKERKTEVKNVFLKIIIVFIMI
jgi:hypothetical protein